MNSSPWKWAAFVLLLMFSVGEPQGVPNSMAASPMSNPVAPNVFPATGGAHAIPAAAVSSGQAASSGQTASSNRAATDSQAAGSNLAASNSQAAGTNLPASNGQAANSAPGAGGLSASKTGESVVPVVAQQQKDSQAETEKNQQKLLQKMLSDGLASIVEQKRTRLEAEGAKNQQQHDQDMLKDDLDTLLDKQQPMNQKPENFGTQQQQNQNQLMNDLASLIRQQLKDMKSDNDKMIDQQKQKMLVDLNQIDNKDKNDNLRRIAENLDDQKMTYAVDCSDYYRSGQRTSGVYKVKPTDRRLSFKVFCDLESEGGGWTVFQRRGEYEVPDDYFNKNWNEYKYGFGDLNKEFWLGNDQIYSLTSGAKYSLRIDMIDYNDTYVYADYADFSIDTEESKYKLRIGGYTSNDTYDAMSYSNGMKFSTYDNDNDMSKKNCAQESHGGWWYKDCANANLNGAKASDPVNSTFSWYVQGVGRIPLKATEMKIRPKPKTNDLLPL